MIFLVKETIYNIVKHKASATSQVAGGQIRTVMNNIPQHVALIPDGNRRWAKRRGLPAMVGHRQASETTLPKLVDQAAESGIKYFTFWALSTDNFVKRDKEELNNLLHLIEVFVKTRLADFQKKKYRLLTIGDLSKLPESVRNSIDHARQATCGNNGMVLILAINYGGQDEIIRAINRLDKNKTVDKQSFSRILDTGDIPNPDLIIRTGGENRLSGFLLWQSEYSELYFSDRYFPDFNQSDFELSLKEYSERQRRFGK